MSNNQDQDVPFLIPDDDDDDIFSSAPASSLDEPGDEIFSSVPSSPPQGYPAPAPQRTNNVSGGYAAIQPHQANSRNQVVIGADPAQSYPNNAGVQTNFKPSTGGYQAVQQGGAPRLEILDPHGMALDSFALLEGRNVIGTGTNVEITIDDPFISKWHATLTLEHGALMLEDLSSINGIYLGIADEFQLEDGDELRMGSQRFRYHAATPLPELVRPFATQPEPFGARISKDYPHLIQFVEGGYIGGLYPLHDVIIIGRNNADIRCPQDNLLEDKHASIERRGSSFVVNDLQSRFGTYIRVSDTVELINGDCFVVGQTRLRIHM